MRTGLIIAAMLLFVAGTSGARVRNVPADYSSIQKGIGAAAEGDTVLVAPGMYKENISLNRSSITLASHFLNQQDTTLISQTVIEAAGEGPVVKIFGLDSTTVFTGFTIVNRGGGGISCELASPRLRFLMIKGEGLNSNESSHYTAGIYLYKSYVSVDHVDIRNNLRGGMWIDGSSITLSNLNIIYNSDFGGIYINQSKVIMVNSIVSDNGTYGVYSGYKSILELNNCLVTDNYGYGISSGESFVARHCTIANNIKGGIQYGNKNNFVIENSIIAYNPIDTSRVKSNYLHCLIWNNEVRSVKPCPLVTVNANGDSCDANANIFLDPAFSNRFLQDYHLSDFSPAIGVGIADSTVYDLEGKKRWGIPDIGALENDRDLRNKSNVIITGRVLLENQAMHAGVKIKFEKSSDEAMTDSTVSNNDGTYSVELRPGEYRLFLQKSGYCGKLVENVPLYSSIQYPDVILRARMQIGTVFVPDDYKNIQIAIDSAAPGDTVLVTPGTYVENINFKGKSNIVVGSYFISTGDTSYISKTIIDGNKKGHVVEFSSGEDSTCVLSGFTIRNGGLDPEDGVKYDENDFFGAGIFCMNSSPRLLHLLVRDNVFIKMFPSRRSYFSGSGGGLYCNNSNPIVENTTFIYNGAESGSGIYCTQSNPQINDVSSGDITLDASNPAMSSVRISGRMYCIKSSPKINKITIENNEGAGLDCSSSNPDITDLIIQHITAWEGESGWGIYLSKSSPVIRNALISDIDKGTSKGAGIGCLNGSNPTFINLIVRKVSGDDPRSIYCESSSPTFINATIAESLANSQYWMSFGILSGYKSRPVLINSIITDHAYGVCCSAGGTITISHSNVCNSKMANFSNFDFNTYTTGELRAVNANGDSCTLGLPVQVNANGDSCDAFFNISLDPKFTNGYHLSADSPCIGAGTAKDAPEFDLDGIARHNPPDMGAYEFDRPVSVNESVPLQFTLLPNHPNPFNPSTTLSFTLPAPARAELAVYSITGQRVRTLLSERKSAGTYVTVWDGKDDSGRPVSSGVYFSRLSAGKHVATGKMLLLR